jgi:TPR repeat protein
MELLDLIILRFHEYSDDADVGNCYYYGKHVTQNIDIANRYYNQAANKSDPKAFLRLSDIATENKKQAESCYLKAQAFEAMGLWKTAVGYYRDAAALLHTNAMCKLAEVYKLDRYENDMLTIKADISKRLNFYRKAILFCNKKALTMLIDESKENSVAAVFFSPIACSTYIIYF